MASLADLQLNKHLYRGIDDLAKTLQAGSSNVTVGQEELPNVIYPDNIVVDGSTDGDTVPGTGGGGGTPGGDDTQIQYNNAGSFDGVPAGQTLSFIAPNELAIGAGFISTDDSLDFTIGTPAGTTADAVDIAITGGDSGSGTYTYGGSITLTGGNSASGYGYGGGVYIAGGNTTDVNFTTPGEVSISGGTTNVFHAVGAGAPVVIHGGHSGTSQAYGFTLSRTGYGDGGDIQIVGGSSSTQGGHTGIGGDITLTPGTGYTSGNIIMRFPNATGAGTRGYFRLFEPGGLYVTAKGINFAIGNKGFGNGTGGVISMQNATAAPNTNISGGGLLYVLAGALYFRGSGGTVTTIAPA